MNNKYNLEGDIDFYKQLQHSITEECSDDDHINVCFITQKPLVEPYITLACSHTFNYVPLYKDISCVKANNHMERDQLKANEIRCPYCRRKELHVMPYVRIHKCPKKDGVNWLDVFKHKQRNKLSCLHGTCNWEGSCDNTCVLLSPDSERRYCCYHYMEMYPRKIAQNVPTHENVVVESVGCCAILKTGNRAGHQCGAKPKMIGLCGRHVPK